MKLQGDTLEARVREVRGEESQAEFAARLRDRDGHAPQAMLVSRWERGAAEPSLRYLRQIAQLGGVTLDELVNGNGQGGAT